MRSRSGRFRSKEIAVEVPTRPVPPSMRTLFERSVGVAWQTVLNRVDGFETERWKRIENSDQNGKVDSKR